MQSFYDAHIMPRLINWACGYRRLAGMRREIVPAAEGVVVEFGIGSGYNLKHYDPARVKRVIGVDPNPVLTRLGAARFIASPVEVELVEGRAEAAGLDSALADTVLVTYTLCSVDETAAALAEARRVLKPGGRLLFLEHGLSPDARVAARQARWTRYSTRLAGGCHLDRDMEALIAASGFAFDWIDKRWLPRMPATSAFQYLGAARVR
jgi:ubiquinone/menaquinone biosynthesis C-methylase UbiE